MPARKRIETQRIYCTRFLFLNSLWPNKPANSNPKRGKIAIETIDENNIIEIESK
jgi:hypothetical protein